VVEISGKVRGNIKARTRVKILSGGEVRGNLETPTISMEDGVVFEGNCTRPAQPDPSAQVQIAKAGANLRKAIAAAPIPEPQPVTTA
jgi:cytoskeletal protein CcmA (bactofilin family)